MKTTYIFQLLILAGLINLSVQWSGSVCSRRICAYRWEYRCAYRTWRACCYYKRYKVPDCRTVYFCCPGWRVSTNEKCDVAICNPPCLNGGRCETPNRCVCGDGAVGPTCHLLVCNYQRPCFPGTCTILGSNNVNCDCSSGFRSPSSVPGDYCRQLESDQRPVIFELQARFGYWLRLTGITPREKYSLYVDSTNSTDVDYVWTNRKMFNQLNINASAQYMAENIPGSPFFVEDYGLGIARAEARLYHEKIPYTGSNFTTTQVSFDETLPCAPAVSSGHPTESYICDIDKPNYDRSLENGDKLTITFKVWSGGYRQLREFTGNRFVDREFQNFSGQNSEKAMAYRFDFLTPTHTCLETGSRCTSVFSLDDDITKDPVILRWSNWTDVPSGMHRYAWEVFRLQVDGNQVLKEFEPLNPIDGPIEVNQSSSASNSFLATYTPSQPGVYSFILEASDKANNSVFVRRIAIYDPDSSVTIDAGSDNRLYISSADPNEGYNWQDDTSRDIKATWTNHFVNLKHEEGKWLNQVLAYPPQLEDLLKKIPKDSGQDDHEGNRTVDAIPNKRGVVKFEIVYAKDSNAGVHQTEPTTGWVDVGLSETYTTPAGSFGGTLTNREQFG